MLGTIFSKVVTAVQSIYELLTILHEFQDVFGQVVAQVSLLLRRATAVRKEAVVKSRAGRVWIKKCGGLGATSLKKLPVCLGCS